MLSDSKLAMLLRARDRARDKAVRLYASLQPGLRRFEAAQRKGQKIQPSIDKLTRDCLRTANLYAEREAWLRPVPFALGPSVADDAEKVALREEIQQLRSELDAYADQRYDEFLTDAFGGPENEVSPDDFDLN